MAKRKDITFSYSEYNSPVELSEPDRELLEAALQTAEKAYAPYSKFRVGAAVRLSSGKIVCGANVENAAFPSGVCAERNALANAITNYSSDKPEVIAIAALTGEGQTDDPVSPCGNCRQVIAEEELRNGNKIRLILSGRSKINVINSIGDMLPLQFSNRNLMNLP